MPDYKHKKIAITLTGNLQADPMAQAKYGDLVRALDRQLTILGVIDAEISGPARLMNAAVSFRPDRKKWKERFRKNPYAHGVRTQHVKERLSLINPQLDFIFQIGALFDSIADQDSLPTLVYTDYTYHLAAARAGSGRSPFNPKELARLVKLERRTFERAERVFVRSRLVRDSLVDDYHIPTEKVIVVGAGVNFDPLPQIEEKVFSNKLLFIGLDFHRKGGDILLRAFEIVKRQIPDAELLLVTRDEIPAGYSLEGVKLVPPTWERDRLAELYKSASVFVLPSRLETWGDVLLEAMAFGVPCVGVQQDAMSEIITHSENGYLVPPDDPQALAEVLIQLLNDPGQLQQMGGSARNTVERSFTWDIVVDRILGEIFTN
jgi:glycosyltransferase involved in cell wall biosynthesis